MLYVFTHVHMYVCMYVYVMYVPCEQTVKTAQELRNPVYCGVATKALPYDQVEIIGSHKVMLICNYSKLLCVVWIRPATWLHFVHEIADASQRCRKTLYAKLWKHSSKEAVPTSQSPECSWNTSCTVDDFVKHLGLPFFIELWFNGCSYMYV